MKRHFLWGAQAASLLFSAACRKDSPRFDLDSAAEIARVIGRLPMTAGWQPALPRFLGGVYET